MSDLNALCETADQYANGSRHWAEVQPGRLEFHFQNQKAFLGFGLYVERSNYHLISADEAKSAQPEAAAKIVEALKQTKAPSDKFRACRQLVHDDAFEARLAVHMALPLLKDTLRHLKGEHLHDCGVFLRRALTRYLTIALCRLLDKPQESGRTGITASIASLLEMAKDEEVLLGETVSTLQAEFEKIKKSAAEGEYDLVMALYDLRTTQVAHSLIPWEEPTDTLWSHHVVDFAEAIFDFVVRLETTLTHSTGQKLSELTESAANFGSSANEFWHTLVSVK